MVSRYMQILLAAMLALGTMATAPGPGFTPAHHRNPPQVPQRDEAGKTCPPAHDCPAAKRLRIVSIIPGNFPFSHDLWDFGNAIVGSTWMAKFTHAYDIPGPASAVVIGVDDMPNLNGDTKDVSDYRDYVFKKARANGVKKAPHHQTLYLLYIPCNDNHQPRAGMDKFGCVSHHPGIDPGPDQDVLFEPGDSMAVVLAFNPKPGEPAPTLDSFTTAASHELAEAATDTRGGPRFSLHTDDADHPYLDSGSNAGGTPWVRESGTIELADMSEGAGEYEASAGHSAPFRYARIYSNKASKAGGDPAVPASTSPYYNVSTGDDWLTVHGGASVNIPVTAWAAAAIGDWDVDVKVSSWHRQQATPPAAAPCSLSKNHWSVHNGSKFDVPVDTNGHHTDTVWCILKLKSTKSFFLGDDFHEWFVGVIIKPPPSAHPTPTPFSEPCVCADGTKAGPGAKAGSVACEHICRGHEHH
jgi:hypothetical protein